MSCDYYRIILIFILLIKSSYSCWNISLNNITFSHVENLNFFLGKSQPKNISCSWMIHNDKQLSRSYYVLSLRTIELEYNRTLWSNELILKTNGQQITLDNINQRTFFISSSNLEIYFRTKSPKLQSDSLNIHRFLLEFIHVNNNNNNNNNNNEYFHCLKSGLIIPKQWKCNCLYECSFNDYSDEEDCPLCSMIKSSNTLLCHSNEFWCLPVTSQIDSKGVCIPHEQNAQCSYSLNCETIVSYSQDHGEIFLDNSILSNRESLCFIIITKEKHKLKLVLNQYNFINQRPDLELFVYDGSEQQNQILTSSNSLLTKETVQTRQSHIATIVIRKNSIQNQNSLIHQYNIDNILVNITWLSSLCEDNQFLCGGHFETKCYSYQQRCDGIWDCINGDDELGCLPISCPTTFACHDSLRLPSDQPRCYTWFERCNGNAYCANRTDEQNCTNWWCNSHNGTFLCKNRNCIYEIWACDGTDDCGDNSDEINCPTRIPRRIMTAAVIGATICCTLFLIALGCTCKLIHLRSAEQRASARLLNPEQYIEQRRLNRPQTAIDNTPDDTQRIAPPSYNQTMGFSNDNEERFGILAERLRLAGLTNFMPFTSGHRNRRHRRHRRHRRTHHEGSCDPLIETHSNRFDRFRSLFTRNLSVNNNSIPSNEFDISERHIVSIQPIVLSTRELPPPYSEEQLSSIHYDNDVQPLIITPTTSSSSLIRIHKGQIPLNIIRNHLEEQSSSPPVATIEVDEQASSDDDDDDKLLVP